MITELDLLMRALASRTRLRILSILIHAPEDLLGGRTGVRPADIARRLNVTPSAVSQHLRILLRLRLVRYWKNGVLKHYRLKRFTPGSFRDRLARRLAQDLPSRIPPVFAETPAEAARRGVRRAKPRRLGQDSAPEFEALWAELTCYSHFRRILMLKHLQKHHEAPLGALAAIANIHPLTAAYHADKLLRREEIVSTAGGFRLRAPKPQALRRLVHEAAATGPAGTAHIERP